LARAVSLALAASLVCAPSASAQARRPTRSAAPPAKVWSALSAGSTHTCALDNTGQAYCWGDNAWKRLGITDSVNQRRPAAVETPQHFFSLASGADETCALTIDGSAVCWGGTQPGAPPHSAFGVLRLRALDLNANGCGIAADSAAWCWGSNAVGQLGSGRATPTRSTGAERVRGPRKWRTVTVGGTFACGVAGDGRGWCWGSGTELGAVAIHDRSAIPVQVAGERTWQVITAGAAHGCGIAQGGAAWCWGNSGNGALGNGQNVNQRTPVAVSGGLTFASLAAGYSYTCGLTPAGKAYCWGWNENGVLGNGTTRNALVPTAVSGTTVFTSLSGGTGHVCGITSTGAVFCWGDNADGALGAARSQTCRTPLPSGRYEVRQCAMVPTRVVEPR
jgi:alpha-tubulin suppressor-like RCC1 family protein